MKRIVAAIIIIAFILSAAIVVMAQKGTSQVAQEKDFNKVEIFRGNQPAKKYTVIGPIDILVPPGMSRATAVTVVKKEAAKQGADAVIDVVIGDARIAKDSQKPTVRCEGSDPNCQAVGSHTATQVQATGTMVKWQ